MNTIIENELTMPNKMQSSKVFLVLFLGIMAAFGPFVTDLYLPALPDVMTYFGSSISVTQLTLTACMAGLAVGQLIIGPLSDKYGRKRPLFLCLLVFTLSSVAIVFATDIETLIVLRLVQGLSSAGGVVISRAAATDLYQGAELEKFFAMLMTVNGVAPIIAPVVGSVILQWTDWRGVFICLCLLGAALTVACLNFDESFANERRLKGHVLSSYLNYLPILKNHTFMLLTVVLTLLTASLFAYISASAFIYQQHYGFDSLAYGLFFAFNAGGFTIGAHLSGKLAATNALRFGVWGALLTSLILAAAIFTSGNFWIVETMFFAFGLFYGLVMPSAAALAINLERRYAGSASAMIGFFPFFICGVVSPLTGIGNPFNTTAIIMLICSLGALLIYKVVVKRL